MGPMTRSQGFVGQGLRKTSRNLLPDCSAAPVLPLLVRQRGAHPPRLGVVCRALLRGQPAHRAAAQRDDALAPATEALRWFLLPAEVAAEPGLGPGAVEGPAALAVGAGIAIIAGSPACPIGPARSCLKSGRPIRIFTALKLPSASNCSA